MPEEDDKASMVLPYSPGPLASGSAVVWCRLLALVMLGWGVQSAIDALAQMIDFLPQSSFSVGTMALYGLGSALPASIWLILGWYCWVKAPLVADRMARDRTENLSPQGMSADELLTTMMIGIGIYMLTGGLPAVAQYLFESFSRVQSGIGPFGNFYGRIVGAIIRCALGLWLILGTRGIVTIIRRHSGRWRDPAKPID